MVCGGNGNVTQTGLHYVTFLLNTTHFAHKILLMYHCCSILYVMETQENNFEVASDQKSGVTNKCISLSVTLGQCSPIPRCGKYQQLTLTLNHNFSQLLHKHSAIIINYNQK